MDTGDDEGGIRGITTGLVSCVDLDCDSDDGVDAFFACFLSR